MVTRVRLEKGMMLLLNMYRVMRPRTFCRGHIVYFSTFYFHQYSSQLDRSYLTFLILGQMPEDFGVKHYTLLVAKTR